MTKKMGQPEKELDQTAFNGFDDSDKNLKNIRCSRDGRILNIKTGNILKPYKMKKGHTQVSVSLGGKVKKYLVHRIIAKCFIDNPANKPCVNHINGIPWDNRVENLEWCHDSENKEHARINGMFQQSCERYNSRFDECEVLTIHTLRDSGISQAQIGRLFNAASSVICNMVNHKTYKPFAVIHDKQNR